MNWFSGHQTSCLFSDRLDGCPGTKQHLLVEDELEYAPVLHSTQLRTRHLSSCRIVPGSLSLYETSLLKTLSKALKIELLRALETWQRKHTEVSVIEPL